MYFSLGSPFHTPKPHTPSGQEPVPNTPSPLRFHTHTHTPPPPSPEHFPTEKPPNAPPQTHTAIQTLASNGTAAAGRAERGTRGARNRLANARTGPAEPRRTEPSGRGRPHPPHRPGERSFPSDPVARAPPCRGAAPGPGRFSPHRVRFAPPPPPGPPQGGAAAPLTACARRR